MTITKSILHDGNYGLIIYVINATQIGIDDDKQLLMEIKSVIGTSDEHKDVLFVVNKIDEIDEEKECIRSLMKNIQTYLKDNGFENPVILPISAYSALLARKIMGGEKLTRIEQMSLFYQLKHFEESPFSFVNIAHLSSNELCEYATNQVRNLKNKLPTHAYIINQSEVTDNVLESFIHYTGLGLLEHLIQNLLINVKT